MCFMVDPSFAHLSQLHLTPHSPFPITHFTLARISKRFRREFLIDTPFVSSLFAVHHLARALHTAAGCDLVSQPRTLGLVSRKITSHTLFSTSTSHRWQAGGRLSEAKQSKQARKWGKDKDDCLAQFRSWGGWSCTSHPGRGCRGEDVKEVGTRRNAEIATII
jgi:hypothetical protein